jgi:photosystem II stability/assembly factor-like uncharacterized protein
MILFANPITGRPTGRPATLRRLSPPMRFSLMMAALWSATPASAEITWTQRHGDGTSGEFLWGVTDGSAGIVAVGTHGKILHSLDGGLTWTNRQSGTTAWLVAVTYGDGRYVAVGDRGTVLTSSDARTWTQALPAVTIARLNNVLFGANQFVAVGEEGTVVHSRDGTRWEAAPSGVTGWLRGIAFAGAAERKIWIVTGQSGTILRSADGIQWFLSDPPPEDLECVVTTHTGLYQTYFYPKFLAVGSNGGAFTIDVYGGAENFPTGTTARLRSLANGNGVFVAVGENGTVLTSQRPAGPWSPLNLNTSRNLLGTGFAGGTLLLVGENETIFQTQPLFTSRLSNISTRGYLGAGAETLIAGTVLQGSGSKRVLFRGVGPGLLQFGITSALPDPVLTVYNAAGTEVASNSGWTIGLSQRDLSNYGLEIHATGAFLGNTRDAALMLNLDSGLYTFRVSSATGREGTVLIETYYADQKEPLASRAINVSTRGQVGDGERSLIAGLVVQGPSSRTLLIRGVGPTLGQFGVSGTLPDPIVTVFTSGGTMLGTNDNWNDPSDPGRGARSIEEIEAATAAAGAFPLTGQSKDAALLITLVPGNYTVQVSGANNTRGVALVEAYDVPNN